MGADDASNPLAPEFANPLPPPSKPKGAGGSAPAATPMSNSDFRKLLSTPRAAGGAQVAPKGGRRGGGGDFQKPKPRKPAPRPAKPEEVPEGPAYRDRAKERREQSAPEYQGELSGAVLAGVPGGVPGVTARDELRQLSVEESKFLGGDVEHTHLVKGLDFALLRKVRAEMAETEKDVAFERAREARASADARGSNRVPGRVPDPLDASSSPGTAFGRAVADAALAASALEHVSLAEVRPNERFASGRVSFAFDLSDASASDVPATTMRSASDPESRRADAGANRVLVGKDAAVLERLGAALTRVRAAQEAAGGDDKKARRRAERAAAAAAAAARAAELAEADRPRVVDAEDDEDIFGDAGRDYVPTVSARGSGADAKAASYFGDGAAKGEASTAPRATRAKEEDVGGDAGADARGLDGPMPEPPAPDFNSIEPFKAHYQAYVAAGTVGGAWDSVAAGDYLREHPEFALAVTAHSVRVQREEEEREAEAAAAAAAKTPAAEKRPGTRGPMDAAAARAELERRAEESLAADDGYGECYAGGAYGGASFYASDDEEEEGKKKKGADEGEDGNKGKKSGLGAGGKDKDGKMSARALEAQRDQKINSELGSLHKVMREKYGDKVDVAFGEAREGKGAKRGGETGGEGDGAAGEDEGGGGRRGKRLKI